MEKNEKTEKREKNGNVILLIVIAIATMVIVVVGATFAYLASITDNTDTSNINATTEGSTDLLMLDAGDDLSVHATFDNFGQNMGDQADNTVASVRLSSAGEASYKYRMFLEIGYNDFEYTSGACYQTTQPVPEYTTRAECLDGTSNLWARAAGSADYACYAPGGEQITDPNYADNEMKCSALGNTMWAQDIVPELVLDVYSGTVEEDATNCVADETDDSSTKGVCLNPDGDIVSAPDKGACKNDGNTWVSNVHKDGMCFTLAKRMDVTTAITAAEETITIFNDVEISATAESPAAHYYLAEVRMINLDHNQIVNGDKRFNGNLTLSVVNKDGSNGESTGGNTTTPEENTTTPEPEDNTTTGD